MTDREQNLITRVRDRLPRFHDGGVDPEDLYPDKTLEFEKLHELSQKVARRQNEKLERELVLALHHGFDGVDTALDLDGNMIVQPWTEGNEPHGHPWDSHHRRYDLRDVSYHDLRELHERAND